MEQNKMRTYSCFFGVLDEGKIISSKISSKNRTPTTLSFSLGTACWSGIQRIPKETKYIYIYNYNKNKFLDRLIQLINNITPCKFVTINNKEYIRYKLIDYKDTNRKQGSVYYTKNLTLLNFIRMNWFLNNKLNHEGFVKSIMKKSRGIDSLYFMLSCVKDNIDETNNPRGAFGNHSLVYKNIKPKKAKELLQTNSISVQKFVTT